MKLNEKHFTFVVISFYRHLKSIYGNTGLNAFSKAQQLYGEQRGRRMSYRALRDGKPLDFKSYFTYGELDITPGFFEMEMVARTGVVQEYVTKCPFADTFADGEAKDCGIRYCSDIDKSVVRGFNPHLLLEMRSMIHKDDCCHFEFKNDSITAELFNGVENKGLMPFDYHCGHLYKTFCEVITEVFGESNNVIANVRSDVCQKYSKEMLQIIDSYKTTDFNKLS